MYVIFYPVLQLWDAMTSKNVEINYQIYKSYDSIYKPDLNRRYKKLL